MSDSTVVQWLSDYDSILTYFQNKKECMGKYNKPIQYGSCCCLIFTCIPCCIWSSFWRILLCPCMCIIKGAGFACSNNKCTDCTDNCLSHVNNEVWSKQSLSLMPNPSLFTSYEAARIIKLLDRTDQVFEDMRLAKKKTPYYDLAEVLFQTLPALVPLKTNEIRKKFSVV